MAKGVAVRFVGGKYGGKKGWIDTAREHGENTIPVIVDQGKKGLKETYVFEASIEFEPTTAPRSYAEAVFQQCTDLDCSLTKLCRDLAKVNIENDAEGLLVVIQRKLTAAVAQHQAKGSKALYRKINYAPDSTNMNL
jgi:hypothetical protein